MQVSARNQFHGIVSAIVPGAVNAEVEIRLPGGEALVASITCESLQNLAIELGKPVVALVKAPHVFLVSDFGGYRLSARNQMSGIVTHLKAGPVNTEVELQLKGGEIIVSTITHESSQNLVLRKGQTVTAVFKAGSVVLAVPQ
ncbi:MAG: transporter [Methylococcaceae bacterium]|jgi:molybdate transport system regulatory protein|nr:transporter [Methylococcaceae bacterium]